MTAFEIILLVGIVALIALQFRKSTTAGSDDAAALKAELKEKERRIGELQSNYETEKSEKNKLLGQNKQMYEEQVGVKEEIKTLAKERDVLKKQITEFEANERQREKEHQLKLMQASKLEEALRDTRERVIQEEQQKRQHAEEERDRLWAEHEKNVVAQLSSLCKSPQMAFAHYTNTNLPDDFDGSLKPDFLLEFLDQYIIFDAKASKAESLQTYINNAVKTTAQKAKKNPKIATMIFLVVPTEAISELKNFAYSLDGYTIYVVSPESLSPILASLKKITTYEFADQMDPQERENIVQLIADLDFHINFRNAADIIMTKMGTEILQKAENLDPAMAREVALKKQPMNAKAGLAATELKKIIGSLTAQNLEVQQLVSPKAGVKKKDLQAAESMMESLL